MIFRTTIATSHGSSTATPPRRSGSTLTHYITATDLTDAKAKLDHWISKQAPLAAGGFYTVEFEALAELPSL